MQQTTTPRADQGCVLVSGLDSTLAKSVLQRLSEAGIEPKVTTRVRGRIQDPAVGGNLLARVSVLDISVAAADQDRAAAAIADLFPAQGDAPTGEIVAELDSAKTCRQRDEDPSYLGLISVGLLEGLFLLVALWFLVVG